METYYLVFIADFSDDVVFDEQGDIVRPAGHEAAKAVVDSLNGRGLHCSEVAQRDYYGWEFRLTYRDATIDAFVQRIDKWILALAASSSWKGALLHRSTPSLRQVAESVTEMLKVDLSCKELSVYSDDDFPYKTRESDP